MKKQRRNLALALLSLLVLGSVSSSKAQESVNPYGEPFKIRCTVYYPTGNPCANGRMPVEGLSVAGKSEWRDKACVMYECLEDGSRGELIGIYEITDTGYGIPVPDSELGSIQAGLSIDRFCEDEISGMEWIRNYGDYVYIQIIEAEG